MNVEEDKMSSVTLIAGNGLTAVDEIVGDLSVNGLLPVDEVRYLALDGAGANTTSFVAVGYGRGKKMKMSGCSLGATVGGEYWFGYRDCPVGLQLSCSLNASTSGDCTFRARGVGQKISVNSGFFHGGVHLLVGCFRVCPGCVVGVKVGGVVGRAKVSWGGQSKAKMSFGPSVGVFCRGTVDGQVGWFADVAVSPGHRSIHVLSRDESGITFGAAVNNVFRWEARHVVKRTIVNASVGVSFRVL
jgi:hypothetical protein